MFSFALLLIVGLELGAQNQPSFEVNNLSINDAYSNFGTAFYGEDNLVFSSTKGRGMTTWVNPENQNVFYHLYKGTIKEASSIEEIKRFKPSFLSSFHESNLVFSQDLNEVYITQSNQKEGVYIEGNQGAVSLKVYKSTKDSSGKWGPMVDLPFNSDHYSVAHPTLSADGKTLYVASDKPGTYGETDLYKVAILEDGSYGPMVNLGPLVNTKFKESFPFIGSNEVLYFSSDRPGGMGGLDIYASRLIQNYYSEPVSLEFPINSNEDDFSFIFKPEENTGYFSSNRSGGKGGDDIYSFKQTSALEFKCQQLIEGQITELDVVGGLADISVILLDGFGNALQSTVTDADGNYAFVVDCSSWYTVMVNAYQFYKNESVVETSDDMKQAYVYNFDLEREVVVVNEKEQLNLNTIFFEVNSSYLTEQAMRELEKVYEVMLKYPEMKIEIGSHTDSTADDAYNLWLSDRRAKRTRDYIIDKGIEVSRISAIGYGEEAVLNKCINDVPCSED